MTTTALTEELARLKAKPAVMSRGLGRGKLAKAYVLGQPFGSHRAAERMAAAVNGFALALLTQVERLTAERGNLLRDIVKAAENHIAAEARADTLAVENERLKKVVVAAQGEYDAANGSFAEITAAERALDAALEEYRAALAAGGPAR